MSEKQEIKKNFKVIDFVINPTSLKSFEVMENRRKITETAVKRISGSLSKGINPIGILIVNKRGEKYRLIDGNHRIEAIRKFFTNNSNKEKEIQCVLRVYSNLTDEEERQVFSDEAKRINQTHEDTLSMYRDTIPFWHTLIDPNNKFPCKVSIYNQENSLRFRTMLDSLYTIKNRIKGSYKPMYLGKEELVIFARSLGETDFLLYKKFINIFQQVFGNVGRQNPYSRRGFLMPLFDIFVKNFHLEREDKVRERFSLLIKRTDILLHLDMTGREAQEMMREMLIRYMTKGHRGGLI